MVDYYRGADGRVYEEGVEGFVLTARRAAKWLELPDGRVIPVDDHPEGPGSGGSAVSDKLRLGDVKEAKQTLKRRELLEKQLATMAVERVVPTGPNVRKIKDEKYLELLDGYKKAYLKGEHREHSFQPLSTYQHKLTTRSGTVVRPVFQGEVGVYGDGEILVLEEGYGRGLSVPVPEDVIRKEAEDE